MATYPRVPHLAPGPGITRDDLVLTEQERDSLLSSPMRVEEKLDGANIGFAVNGDGDLVVATRGGVGTTDRGGHLGRVRAWAGERSDELREVLSGGSVLYGEWLLTRHGVRYQALSDWFVAFDLLDPQKGWLSPNERDERLRGSGLATPPVLADLDDADLATIDALMGASQLGAPTVEGVIVRPLAARNDVPRLAKRIAQDVPRPDDHTFGRHREENRRASHAPAA